MRAIPASALPVRGLTEKVASEDSGDARDSDRGPPIG